MSWSAGEFAGTDRFEVEDRLGSGGFGVVYRAYDRTRRTAVALKTLPNASADAILRFKREFRTLADISHPNLVSLHELVFDGEHWFFTMELIEGVDFLQYIYGGDVPRAAAMSPTDVVGRIAQEAAGITTDKSRARHLCDPATQERLRLSFAQLTSGLAFLHHKGVLHRDIKPANVLVTQRGRLVLLDFGLSTSLGAPVPDNGVQQPLIGTPEYMPPELAEGKALPAGDWYSAGTMLFEAMTGQLPYRGSGYALLMQKATTDAPRARELADCVPLELDALCASLLERDPEKRPPVHVIRSVAQEKPSSPVRLAGATLLKRTIPGRERHLARLNDSLAATRSGRASIVIVRGRSGMGKTHLVQTFLDDVKERIPDAIALYARCHERESVPFKALDPLIDALATELAHLPYEEATAVLPDERGELARLFPAFATFATAASLTDEDPREVRRRAFTALRELLVRLARRRTLILAIDDLHWGDVDSALVLADLFRGDPPPLLLISSYRSEEADSAPFLVSFRRAVEGTALRSGVEPGAKLSSLVRARIEQVVLEELSFAEATAVAAEILAPAFRNAREIAEQIARESGGNPYFIVELARHALSLEEPGTDELRLETVVAARVTRFSPEAREVAATLAVAGRPLQSDICRTAAGVENTYQSTVASLRAAGIIRVVSAKDSEMLELAHERIRDLLLSDMPPHDLRSRHEALALTLEASDSDDYESIAFHFRAAGEAARAVHHLLRAAARAEAAMAFESAARLYRAAIEWRGREQQPEERRLTLLRLAEVLINGSRGSEAARVLLEAAGASNDAAAVDLQRRAAEQLLRSGHVEEGLALTRGVIESLGMELPQSNRKALAQLLLRRIQLRLKGVSFRGEKPVLDAKQLARVDTMWSVAIGLGLIDPIRGAAFQTEHALLAIDCGDPFRASRAIALEAAYISAEGTRKRSRSEQLFDEAEALARSIERPDAVALSSALRGISAVLRGEWERGEQLCRAAEKAVARHRGMTWELFNTQLYATLAMLWRGDLDQVWKRLPTLLEQAVARGDLYAETYVRTRLKWLEQLLRHGLPDLAATEGRQAIARWTQNGFHTHHYHYLLAQTEIALYGGDPRLAEQLISDGWPALKRSMLLHAQIVAIESNYLRARVAVAASLYSSQRDSLLNDAQRYARRIIREGAKWGIGLAATVRGSIALARGNEAAALAAFDDARARLRDHGMELHRLCVRYTAAGVRGDQREMLDVHERIRLCGVRDPEAVARMLVPGLR